MMFQIMNHIVFFLGIFVTAILFANVEIQIEGKEGWAKSLPTWKIENKWTKLFFSCRPLTGYHFFLLLFIFVVFHISYIISLIEPSLKYELRILSFMILFLVIEDFLWFVFNPYFGLKKFKHDYIWWHAPTWWWIMPRDYWLFIPIGLSFYIISWTL